MLRGAVRSITTPKDYVNVPDDSFSFWFTSIFYYLQAGFIWRPHTIIQHEVTSSCFILQRKRPVTMIDYSEEELS